MTKIKPRTLGRQLFDKAVTNIMNLWHNQDQQFREVSLNHGVSEGLRGKNISLSGDSCGNIDVCVRGFKITSVVTASDFFFSFVTYISQTEKMLRSNNKPTEPSRYQEFSILSLKFNGAICKIWPQQCLRVKSERFELLLIYTML